LYSEEELRSSFDSYGQITDVFVRGKNKTYAFVTFDGTAAVEKAVAGGIVTIGGVECQVEKQTSGNQNQSGIYIKGIRYSEGVKDELHELFAGYGKITDVFVRNKDKVFAFVNFEGASAAEKAVAGGSVNIGGVECTVEIQVRLKGFYWR
jgi:RNA recognition motif-containing protein